MAAGSRASAGRGVVAFFVLVVAAVACTSGSDGSSSPFDPDATVVSDWDGADEDEEAGETGSSGPGAAAPAPGTSIRNPVIDADFPDPAIRLDDGTYYAYATNTLGANIQLRTSTDLVTWTAQPDVLPVLPHWADVGWTWAPAVFRFGATYVLYFAGAKHGSDVECIGAATAPSLKGPFQSVGAEPLLCQRELGGSIDPDVRVFDGQPWIYWKSDGDRNGQVTALWAQPLDPSGLALEQGTTPTLLLRPSEGWQNGLIEAPEMHVNAGTYFLLYSANWYNTADYAVGYATCTSPSGPCTNQSRAPWLRSANRAAGPGGQTAFLDDEDHVWMGYHAWTPGLIGSVPGAQRSLRLTRLQVSATSIRTEGALDVLPPLREK